MRILGGVPALLCAACAANQVVVTTPEQVHVEQRVSVEVAGSEEAAADSLPVCAGASLEVVGDTRDGRALGLALLQISARPWIELFVDDAPRGRTPQVAVSLEAGPRDLRFAQPELGYDCTMRLHVHAGLRYAITVDAEQP